MSNAPTPLPAAQRVWVALTQVALFLPFVTARGCGNGQITDYSGIDLYLFESEGTLLALLALVMVPLLLRPYAGNPIPRALAGLGLRAWFAGLGVLLALAAPPFVLLFDELTPRVGWYLHVGGWAALYASYIVGSGLVLARGGGARPGGPLAIGVVVLLAAPPLSLGVNVTHNELTPFDVILGLGAGFGMTLPLALAALGLAREQADGAPRRGPRALWWALTLLTLGTHVAGALAD